MGCCSFFYLMSVYSKLPLANMREVRATTGAVSQRNILAPIEQMCAPVCRAASASDGSKPPSGPVIIAAVVSSFASLSAS